MGLLDRFLHKKHAARPKLSAPPTKGTRRRRRRSSSTTLTDATRRLSGANTDLSDDIGPFIGDSPSPTDLMSEEEEALIPKVVPHDPGDVWVPRAETKGAPDAPHPDAPSMQPTPATIATDTPATIAPASASPTAPSSDDALPLPDEFDPFGTQLETLSPDAATSETRANERASAAPVPAEAAPAQLDDEGHLEEYAEPLPTLAPEPLAVGARLVLDGGEAGAPELTVVELLAPRGEINCYRAHDAAGAALSLREAAQNSAAAAQLTREEAARRAINSPQIPPPAAFGTAQGRVYLADGAGDDGQTFAAQLSSDAPLADLISTITQAAAALAGLHRAGFVHGALRPEAIVLGKPVKLGGFESLSPLGQSPAAPVSFAGYGAPETLAGAPLDARADVYSVGALLLRVVTGAGVPETGWDETTFAPAMLLPGAPQIFAKTLGSPATRYSDMAALHYDLVRLRARLKPLARHESAGDTTIGLEPGRTTNQDAWGEVRGQKAGEEGAVAWTAWVVSDGMGGMASGEVASQTAVTSILREAALWGAAFDGKLPTEAQQALLPKTWTREANRQAVEAMNAIGARGGCTLVCGLLVDRRLTLAHVGDCRTYLFRGGELTQLTRDHSFVMSLVLQGEITREQMRDHPDRSKITRSLGDRHPMPDYFVDGLEVEMKTQSLELQTGDVLLAFSDGVWEPVLEDEMKAILDDSYALEEAAHKLIEAAMRAGGPDNATVYIFQLSETAPTAAKVG